MERAPSGNPVRIWARLDGIDLLRGLAIFFVLMNHANMRLRFAKVPYATGSLRRWGPLSRVSVRDFYLLRFARIAPLLLSLIAILSVLDAAHFQDFVVSANTGGLGQAVFAALTFHVNVLEARRGYLPANWDIIWSLSVEEMFYLFFPLFCRLLGRGKLLVTLLLVFVVLGPFGRTVLAHGNEIWREYSYLGGMDAIALGCLTALFVAQRRLSRPFLWIVGSVALALSIFILGFSIRVNSWGLSRTGLDMTILALGTCMIISVSAQTERRSPRLLAPFLKLGQRSYEVYLTHMFVVFGLFHLFIFAGKPMKAVPVFFISAILLAGLTGELVARFYSEPVNHWLRNRWGEGPKRLSSVIEAAVPAGFSDLGLD